MRRPLCVLVALALAVACATPLTLPAQMIRGVVRDSVSRLPIVGAVVSVFDSSNHAIARTLTVASGRFALTASDAARRLQVLHIGHLPVELRLPARAADGSITIDLAMERVPPRLDAMRSSGTPLCPRPPDQGAGFAIWGQARAEFLAAVVARDATEGTVRVLLYERDINPRTGVITRQTTTLRGGPNSKTSVAARSAATFAERGYLDAEDPDSYFHAPDADVLLDETFATTHCFHVERGGAAHARDIGVAFVPARERPQVADIAGVLWIDSAAHVIRALDYRYTNLRSTLDNGALGGSVTFRVLPNGAPIIERWAIQTSPYNWASDRPIVVPNRAMGTGATRASGAELLEGTWADSSHWTAALGTVLGHVLPSKNVSLPARTVVRFTGTDYAATSDSSGAFRFTHLVPGRYTVEAADEMAAPFGLNQTEGVVVDVSRDSVVRLDIALIGSPLQVLAQPCRRNPAYGASDLLVRIQSPAGPLATAVDARGQLDVLAGGARGVVLETFIDAGRGIEVPVFTVSMDRALASFVVCGVPWGSTLRLRALVGAAVTERSTTLPTGHTIDTLTLIADAGAPPGQVSNDPFTNSDFVHVRPGTFSMGSTKGTAADRPVHEVTLTHSYWIQRHLVTRAQWEAVTGTTPSAGQGCPACPVENVSVGQVHAFIDALNELSPEQRYRLPTEAEWEYAARTQAVGDPGGTPGSVTLRSWMSVNVFEWVADWYGPYPSTAVTDPAGPRQGTGCACRVLRGGSSDDAGTYLRSAAAVMPSPALRFTVRIGFRLARSE